MGINVVKYYLADFAVMKPNKNYIIYAKRRPSYEKNN